MDQSPAAAAVQLAVDKQKLIRAVQSGAIKTAVDLLDRGVPIDIRNDEGISLLHWAAEGGHVTTMRLLIRRGCNVDTFDGRGLSPLHLAAVSGQTKAVRELIRNGANKSVVAGGFGSPLHQAALYGHVETVVAMLEEGCPIDVVNSVGFTVLHFAAEGGNVNVLRELVDIGCDVNAGAKNGCTPLHVAAGYGKTEMVRELVSKGCDVNVAMDNGCTPLHIAAFYGETDAVHELIKLGATKSVVAVNVGTPLHLAALMQHAKTAVAMLEEGCPIEAVDSNGRTALHWAAEGGHVETMRHLVGRGCDVNAVATNGCTPLHVAAGCGTTEAVHELIKLGATKSVVAGTFGTPLHQAAFNGPIETVEAMLEEGCNFEITSTDGSTVLHFAAQGGHAEVVSKLIGRGCDVNAVDAYGSSPLHYAAGYGWREAAHELIQHCATKSVIFATNDNPLHVQNGETDEKKHTLDSCQSNTFTDTLSSLTTNFVNSGNYSGQTPLMWAFGSGHVGVCNLLVTNGASFTAKDKFKWSAFEHCFVGGQTSKLSQLCEACGIKSGEGLGSTLRTLITRGLVDEHKVLCLCAISGDCNFFGSDFIGLLRADCCTLPMIVKYAKAHFRKGVPIIDELPDNSALNPLHISLLSLKLYEMGHVPHPNSADAKRRDAHTSFITKLLSHPVLKETVLENFPNGLSPLDLARQFELHNIATSIEKAGGGPGVWACIPQEIKVKLPLALAQLKEAYPSIKTIAEESERGLMAIRSVFHSIVRQQTVEIEVQTDDNRSWLVKEEDNAWHPNAAIVGAGVGPETDEHEYKSLMVPADKSKKPPPMHPCKDTSEILKKVVDHNKEINAMLNHHAGGIVHFGIRDKDNTVEEGLDLDQAAVIDKLQTRVGQLLQEFYPSVQSLFVGIQPVPLLNSSREPTGRWRFDICVTPHDKGVILLSRNQTVAYYRQGGNSEPMPADMFMKRFKDGMQA